MFGSFSSRVVAALCHIIWISSQFEHDSPFKIQNREWCPKTNVLDETSSAWGVSNLADLDENPADRVWMQWGYSSREL